MPDYSIEVLEHPDDWPVAEWNALLQQQALPTPFMRAECLQALAAGGAGPEQGWHARFVLLRRSGALCAAAPAWAKRHSWGEYVFDQAWAQAYHQHGLPYYPKLVVAVPFTPVPGSRLLAREDRDRQALLQVLEQLARAEGHSGIHLLFGDATDQRAAAVAEIAGGTGTLAQAPFTGRANLYAQTAGLTVLDASLIDAVNATDESVTVATLAPHTMVTPGEMVATVKIIPFAAPEHAVAAAVTAASRAPLRVAPFLPRRAALV